MLWCGVFTTKLWTHSTRRPVAGSMHSGCGQERFSSSSSLVRPGKNSSTSKKGACCSTTGWIVMSRPASWSLIVEVIRRALSPALAFRLVARRRPDRLPRVDLGGRRLSTVGRGPVGLIDLGVVLLLSIAPPRERRLVFLLRIGRRRQQRDDRGGGGQCFHGRLMSQRKPGPMRCIGPTGPAFGITSPRPPKLAPARRRRASHWRRRASESKETAENARDDMLDDPDWRETNTLAATDRRRQQRTTGGTSVADGEERMTGQTSVAARSGLACRLLGGIALLSAVAMAATAGAQSRYPDRPVILIVPYGAGGIADTGMRILAEKLSGQLNQQFVVDNRPGGGGIVAAKAGATAAPDGYTLLMTGNNNSISKTLFSSLPDDILVDFVSS